MKTYPIDVVAKGIFVWVLGIIFLLSICVQHQKSAFFQFGPNQDLHIFYITIDNGWKYTVVVLYTICSTVIRTLQQEVLMPWIIQSVQNDKEKTEYVKKHAYEIVLIDVLYRWFDWFMYMNILLAQIDMTLIETVGNMITSYYMTHYYLLLRKEEPSPPSSTTMVAHVNNI